MIDFGYATVSDARLIGTRTGTQWYSEDGNHLVLWPLINNPSQEMDLKDKFGKACFRKYTLISSKGDETAPAHTMIAVALSPPDELVEDFNSWYNEEHIDLLSKVPGWQRSVRLQLAEGTGPTFAALHFYAAKNGAGKSPEFTHAVTTPWAQKLVGACRNNGPLGYERNVWTLGSLGSTGSSVSVHITRIRTGNDGVSTLTDEVVEMESSSWIGSVSKKFKATSIQFQQIEQTHVASLAALHCSSNPKIEINVNGQTRVRTSDGKSKLVEPGDLVWYEDTSGFGHSVETLSSLPLNLIVLNL